MPSPAFLLLLLLSNGCQVNNVGTETRMEEQMLDISYENTKAEDVFNSIIHGTDRETNVKSRIGISSFSLYSRYEEVAFNAHCNDHIKAMDKNNDLLISQKEAEDYYKQLSDQGKVIEMK